MDIILGVAWLAMLGDVKVNWSSLMMNFHYQGKPVQIKGEPSLTKMFVSPRALRKEKEIEVVSVFWGGDKGKNRSLWERKRKS